MPLVDMGDLLQLRAVDTNPYASCRPLVRVACQKTPHSLEMIVWSISEVPPPKSRNLQSR